MDDASLSLNVCSAPTWMMAALQLRMSDPPVARPRKANLIQQPANPFAPLVRADGWGHTSCSWGAHGIEHTSGP
jgi:hypothetical protein